LCIGIYQISCRSLSFYCIRRFGCYIMLLSLFWRTRSDTGWGPGDWLGLVHARYLVILFHSLFILLTTMWSHAVTLASGTISSSLDYLQSSRIMVRGKRQIPKSGANKKTSLHRVPNGIRNQSVVLPQYTFWANRYTDRHRPTDGLGDKPVKIPAYAHPLMFYYITATWLKTMKSYWLSITIVNRMPVVQTEALQLKSVMSGGRRTKIVALGIGNIVDDMELNATASMPPPNNVIRVQDFTSLPTVRDLLRDTSCTGKWTHSRRHCHV